MVVTQLWRHVAVLLLFPALAHALVIDDFTEGPLVLTSFGEDVSAEQELSGSDRPVGERRRWSVLHNTFGAEPTDSSFSQVTVDVATGVFEFHVDSIGSTVGYVDLEYGSSAEPLNLDLTVEGIDRLRLSYRGVLTSPAGLLDIYLRAPRIDGSGVGSLHWQISAPTYHVGSDPILELPFYQPSSLIDLERVESISLRNYRYPSGNYFRLDKIEAVGTPLTGDYNRDGAVDQADYEYWTANYTLLRKHFVTGELIPTTSPFKYLTVDGSGDGFVNAADYTVWRDAYEAAQQLSVRVPEPAVTALVTALLVCQGLAARRSVT